VIFGLFAKHRAIWPVSWMCDTRGDSRSGFIAWPNRPPSARARSDAVLGARVRRSFLVSDRTYGTRRVWRDVLEESFSCGRHRIRRLVRRQALRTRPRQRRLSLDTSERQIAAIAPNVLQRVFVAPASNQKWVADFTFIWTAEEWLHVAVAIDLYARGVVAWPIKADMTAPLVIVALMMALWRRGRPQ
jgi:putative transposase